MIPIPVLRAISEEREAAWNVIPRWMILETCSCNPDVIAHDIKTKHVAPKILQTFGDKPWNFSSRKGHGGVLIPSICFKLPKQIYVTLQARPT